MKILLSLITIFVLTISCGVQETPQLPRLKILFDDSIYRQEGDGTVVTGWEIKQFEVYDFSIYHYTAFRHMGVEWVVKVETDEVELKTSSTSLPKALADMAEKIERLKPCLDE